MTHSTAIATSRRRFLQATAAAGLVVGFHLHGAGPAAAQAARARAKAALAPNAFVRVAADNTVTVIAKHVEMGQGTYTGLATILAEELDADWAQVRVESAPADAKLYNNLAFGPMQGTGGSSSIANSWEQLRKAGATARAMLVAAAAEEWKVPANEITVDKGVVRHARSKRSAKFGALAERASKLSPPAEVKLKDPRNFKLVGARVPRIDSLAKTNGTAEFALDVKLPGLLVAMIERPPLFGAKLKSFDAARALAVPGVTDVVEVPSGVAVVARNFWAAKRGREALSAQWDDSAAEKRSSAQIMAEYKALAETPGLAARREGDIEAGFVAATRRVAASYEFPYLAHAPMEPLNCTVVLRPDGCDIWAGDQFQTADQANAARVLGLKPEQVNIRTLLAGGSFGRRANAASDYIVEGAEVAKAIKGRAPVKLVWTREDDIRGGKYRPMVFHKIEAGIDATGKPVAWRQHVVGQSIMAGTPFEAFMKDGIDPTLVEGAANLPYEIANIAVDSHQPKVGVPVLWWRSVGHTHTAFAVETFVDELARAAGQDPVEYRRRLLARHPRWKAVLELAAEKAGWGRPLPAGSGRGIAVHESFASYVAEVVEVTVAPNGRLKVDRVVCAVDCGIAVNPDVVRAQMEGGIGYALSAALGEAITLDGGRVQQANFNDYAPLRIDDMPKVEVHIVPSREEPTGVGEPGVPPLAPALANAVFAATGKRVRTLPFSLADLRRA